ncbi:type IV pilus biogenesis protein PilM [Achromobacter aloeverae]
MYSWAIALLVAMLLLGMGAEKLQADRRDETIAYAQALGNNLAIYRAAVARYAQANPAYQGTVTDAALGLPTWFKKFSNANNVISGGKVYVFYLPPGDRPSLDEMTPEPSGLTGVARSGRLVSPATQTVSIALPAVIPEGSIVYCL